MKKKILAVIITLVLSGEIHPQESGTIAKPKNEWTIPYSSRAKFETSYNFGTDTTKQKTIVGKDTVYTNNPYGVVGVVMLVQLWQEYAKECYNDSTMKSVHHPNAFGNGCRYDYGCFVQSHYWDEAFHRQPTFPRFMEWIEKRLKP